ncbi:DUF2171 domain-containing protein [Kaistia dalseonensis]|uniref:DUF2171 domain-containing protein n=1 Tax=Kaistia dalseonensis TaxID=410840 RepID=A0ABU0HA47_9HYPH|nr:DUF2171 domain-containing protein [Kaistia dalseonensis]MCX5496571.1 DUF2171 domain-containing protein [Kaistia dalseonensis]MDQ0439193.1 hypothetical protein [Kaistia dalseonensis]
MINASTIREQMAVVDLRGNRIGTVDHMSGPGAIKLTKSDSPDGAHHYIPPGWVERVDDQVHLNKSSDELMRSRH